MFQHKFFTFHCLLTTINSTQVVERKFLNLLQVLIVYWLILSSKRVKFKHALATCSTNAVKNDAALQFSGRKKEGFNYTGLRKG